MAKTREMKVKPFKKMCRLLKKKKGWNLRKEYRKLDYALQAEDYSYTLRCFREALLRHEARGELTSWERTQIINKCSGWGYIG